MSEKLVRDGMPDICARKVLEEAPGWTLMKHRRVNDQEEYKDFLLNKLREEVEEIIQCPEHDKAALTEEIADLKEVLVAYCGAVGIDIYEVEHVRNRKQEERGGFFLGVIWDGKK